MIGIGVDPGLTGAIGFIYPDGRSEVEDLPTIALPGKGMITKRIDGRSLAVLIRRRVQDGHQHEARAFVEQVGAMGGKDNAVQIQASLGRSLGAIEAVFECLGIPFEMVQPKAWKGFYGLGKDKKQSLRIARELYGDAPLHLAKHDGRAESLLIAHYGLARK